jgi:two-component system sensor histidine kinase PfeS
MERATRSFSQGDFNVRVRQLLGNRNDELSDLADTFDQMAVRIGEQVISQRQLIADLSHELRTPLTRLDIAVQSLDDEPNKQGHIDRVKQESQQIRKLVDDSLTLAWLENERPELKQESLDLADLLDVLIENARFEFSDRKLNLSIPNSAIIYQSNHRALGQALENIIRNALRFTPQNLTVSIAVTEQTDHFQIEIMDQGIGVPEQYLDAIFQPFFRVDTSRESDTSSFGLGLALARRQISAIGGTVHAENNEYGGLKITLQIPIGESSM